MKAEKENASSREERPHLLRRFGLLEATALNMSNMIGIGPFITIPLLLTTLAVIVTGALNFDARLAFDFPPGAFGFSLGFFFGLGAASRIGIYDYLGYYNI